MKLSKDEILDQLVNIDVDIHLNAEKIFSEELYCHKCGNIHIIYEGPAEGYWCPECGSSDSDE